jgi:hypothetical protein
MKRQVPSQGGNAQCKVKWIPSTKTKPGSLWIFLMERYQSFKNGFTRQKKFYKFKSGKNRNPINCMKI